MTTLNNNLSEILDIELMEEQTNEFELVENEIDLTKNEIDQDVEYARNNIKTLIENGNRSILELIQVAKASEHPRAYEVVATMLKNLSELNKDLLELQKRKKDLDPKGYSKNNINVDKAIVFTGSTTELIKLIKQNKEM